MSGCLCVLVISASDRWDGKKKLGLKCEHGARVTACKRSQGFYQSYSSFEGWEKRNGELKGKGRKGEKQEEGKGRYYGGAARLLMRSDNPNPPENQDSCSQIKPVRNKKTLALCSPAFVKTKKQAVSIHFGSRFYLHIKKPPTPVASLLPA